MTDEPDRKLDIQLFLEETLALAIKDYFYGIDKWEKWQEIVGEKRIKNKKEARMWENLVNFKSARFFIFDRWGYEYILEMSGNDYPMPSFGQVRRCCNDIEYLKRIYPENPFRPNQTISQQQECDDECEGTMPFLWKEYIAG